MSKRYKDIVGDGGSNIIGQVVEQTERLRDRMEKIRHKVAVMSGKGGVGKSSITVNLGAALAMGGYKIGVMDADINGPSIAKMMGVRDQRIKIGKSGVKPAEGLLGMSIMSMDLFLAEDATPVKWHSPTQVDAFVWRTTQEMSTLRELFTDTEWGELDFLFIDLPPGTDRFPNLAGLLPDLGGTIIVTIPSEVSQLVVKKSITVAKELKSPIIGLVENMSGYLCPHCGRIGELFTSVGGGVEKVALDSDIPFLGKIPFDPRISASSDNGIPFVTLHSESPAGQAFTGIIEKIEDFLKI